MTMFRELAREVSAKLADELSCYSGGAWVDEVFFSSFLFSTASGALVVGGVRDISKPIQSGDSFECSME